MKKLFIIVLTLFIFSTPIYAQTGGELLGKLNILDTAIQNGIKSANAAASQQQRELFTNASIYTAYVRDNLKDVLNDANKKLSDQQRQIFNKVDTYITAIENVQSGLRTDIQNLTLDFENAITRLPFTDDNPTPSFISIPVLTTSQDKTIEIKIRGVKLNNERNYIVLNGKKYADPIRPSEKENQYRIKLSNDEKFSPEAPNILEIYLFKRNFFGGTKSRKFTAYYSVVPQNIATVSIKYRVSNPVTNYSGTHTEDVNSTPGSTSWREVPRLMTKRGGEGWKIERNSISYSKIRGAEGGSSCSLAPSMITEISFEGKAQGKCRFDVFNGLRCGRTDCRFTWREYFVSDEFADKSQTINLNYQKQQIIQLPKNTHSLIGTEIIFFDGTKYETINPAFSKNFVKVKFDLSNKVAEVAFVD